MSSSDGADGKVTKRSKRAAQWFSQSLFQGFESLMDPTVEPAVPAKRPLEAETNGVSENNKRQKTTAEDQQINSTKDSDEEDSKKSKKTKDKKKKGDDDDEGFEEVPAESFSDDEDSKAEIAALGTLLVKNKLKMRDLVDSSYNRYAYNDPPLPRWFEDEERQHNKPQLPVTKEIIQEIKNRNKAIDAAPIKKIAEAHARKKMKAHKKMEKLKVKANQIAASSDLSERDKMRAIERLYKSQVNKIKPSKVYVVARKFQKGKVSHNAKKGTKVKVVDPRMKKDKMAEKRAAKGKKKH